MNEVCNLREQLRESEASRVYLLNMLNNLTSDMSKQSDETSTKFLEFFGTNGKYEQLMCKFKESVDKFKNREEYFITKINELSQQKNEIENSLAMITAERDLLESKLNCVSEKNNVQQNDVSSDEKNKELQFQLSNLKMILHSQTEINKENLNQLRIFQSRNTSLTSQINELEAKSNNPEPEENFRFTFGPNAGLDLIEDMLESLITEVLHSKNLDLNVIQVSPGVYYIGKIRAEVKLQDGEVKVNHNKEYIPLNEFLDLQLKPDSKHRRSLSTGGNEINTIPNFNESQQYDSNPFDSLDSIESPEKLSCKLKSRPDILSYRTALNLKLAKVIKGYSPILRKKK